MSDLITIFKTNEIPVQIRCKMIIALGNALNHKYAANITESLVFYLVTLLDPEHEIKNNEHYLGYLK